MAGRDYRTQALRAAAVTLGLEQQIVAVPTGSTTVMVAQNGLNVVVRISHEGLVEHIGLPLFNDAIRQQAPSPVYDCVEFAALDRNVLHTENDLLIQKIQFVKGSWHTISTIQPTDECGIGLLHEKVYQVSWSRNGQQLVNMAVPIDYELLMHSSRRELEQNLAREVVKQQAKPHPYRVAEELLQPTDKEGIYVLPGDTFMIKGLSRNTYYQKTVVKQQTDSLTYEEEHMNILVDAAHPAETMANLLMSTAPELPDAVMKLDLQMSSYATNSVSISVQQWLSYCEQQGCTPYYIYDDSQEDAVKGYLLMRNKLMGYNHLLALTCTKDGLVSSTPVLQGKAYLFIPNIKASATGISMK